MGSNLILQWLHKYAVAKAGETCGSRTALFHYKCYIHDMYSLQITSTSMLLFNQFYCSFHSVSKFCNHLNVWWKLSIFGIRIRWCIVSKKRKKKSESIFLSSNTGCVMKEKCIEIDQITSACWKYVVTNSIHKPGQHYANVVITLSFEQTCGWEFEPLKMVSQIYLFPFHLGYFLHNNDKKLNM